jgi:hypothetical protein
VLPLQQEEGPPSNALPRQENEDQEQHYSIQQQQEFLIQQVEQGKHHKDAKENEKVVCYSTKQDRQIRTQEL